MTRQSTYTKHAAQHHYGKSSSPLTVHLLTCRQTSSSSTRPTRQRPQDLYYLSTRSMQYRPGPYNQERLKRGPQPPPSPSYLTTPIQSRSPSPTQSPQPVAHLRHRELSPAPSPPPTQRASLPSSRAAHGATPADSPPSLRGIPAFSAPARPREIFVHNVPPEDQDIMTTIEAIADDMHRLLQMQMSSAGYVERHLDILETMVPSIPPPRKD